MRLERVFMKTKVAIIGTGHVGAHVASALMTQNVCSELVLIDQNEQKALSEACDLTDMAPYLLSDTFAYFGDYSDLENTDIIVVSTCGEFCEEDRLIELESTRKTIDDIIPKIIKSGFDGIIISISNPCDLIAQYIAEKTGLNVIGTGTMLDSARFRVRLAKALGVSSKSVNGFALGEHGNSQFCAFSMASVSGIPLADYLDLNDLEINEQDIEESTRNAGWDVVMGKGCTEHGIGAATAYLIKAILFDEKKVLPCSTYVEKHEIYTSVPCLIGRVGVIKQIEFKLNDREQKAFENSCQVLKNNTTRLK